jgi:hypothetical protein
MLLVSFLVGARSTNSRCLATPKRKYARLLQRHPGDLRGPKAAGQQRAAKWSKWQMMNRRRKNAVNTTAKVLSVFVFLSVLGVAQDAQTQPATDDHFTVAAMNLQDSPFSVAEGVKDVRLSGTFKATGGTASKIIVLVMTDDQYARWQNSHSGVTSTPSNGGALYNSGEVTQGTINLSLPDNPANYHVVFNNTHFRYPKAIEADLKWQWNVAQ